MVKRKTKMMAPGLASKQNTAPAEAPAAAIWANGNNRATAVRLGRLVFCILYGPPSGPDNLADQRPQGAASPKPGRSHGKCWTGVCRTRVGIVYNNRSECFSADDIAVGGTSGEPTAR